MGKGTLLVLLLFLITCLCCLSDNSNSTWLPLSTTTSSGCIEEEREALLTLKRSFGGPNIERLGSWQGHDCCGWQGVSCDNSTGRVLKLDVRAPTGVSCDKLPSWALAELFLEEFLYLRNPCSLEAKEVNPSLTKLKFLKYLDLSGNDFRWSSIPRFLGQMQGLTYLNLSSANFSGIVPLHLGNLSSLEFLDLSNLPAYPTFGHLFVDDFSWVSGLSSLQHLDMSGVRFDQVAPKSMQQVLSQLPSLFYLDLSNCALNNTHLFSSASLPTTLHYLDLSFNHFYGPIPDSLQKLTSLEVLHFSYNRLNSSLPLWLGSLNKLESLHIGGNELNSPDGEIWSILRNSSNLRSLDLSYNQFYGSLPTSLGSYPYLSSLDLSYNQFHGIIPSSLGRLAHLTSLGLSNNQFIGVIPASLGRLSALEWLDLSYNQFTGSLPTSLGRLSSLKWLFLFDNQFIGNIPASFGRLSALKSLGLSHNQFIGSVPTSLGRLSTLEFLDLSSNKLNGTISMSFGQLTNLTMLDLSNNGLNGAIPESLGQLVHLTSLNIDSNALEGVFSEHHLANLSSLTSLRMGNNHLLKLRIDSNWTPPFQLDYIGMTSCKFESKQFPTWLRTQHQVMELDLSNTSISDTWPLWLLEDKPFLMNLDLSYNQLEGPLPPQIPKGQQLGEFIMTDNMLNGSIPTWFCNLEDLATLDLSKNNFSGHIPDCWVGNQSYLQVINLSFNKLMGNIPTSLQRLQSLNWLLLSNNNLIGTIPLGLSKANLSTLDLGGNKLSDDIPAWIGERFPSLQILKLRNNMFKGIIPPQLCLLSFLQILDLADNDLQGSLPTCLGNLTAMTVLESKSKPDYDFAVAMAPASIEEWDKSNVRQVLKGRELEYTSVLRFVVNMDLSGNRLQGSIPQELTQLRGLVGLNLARNQLSGSIPNNIGDLRSLQSLDLSQNHLSGAIPYTLSDLMYLSYLNLSHNNLAGEIPRGNQLQTLDYPFIYQGNPDLCGPPLPQTCPENNPASSGIGGDGSNGGKDTSSEKMWYYLVVVAGYATGFWGAVVVLLLKKNWRHAYFLYVDELKEKIYVTVAVKTGALKKKMKRIKASQPQ